MSYLSGKKTEAQKYLEANAMQSRNGATKPPPEKDCVKCRYLEIDPREEPCFHCGILRKGFEPAQKGGDDA